ncbi:MAG TPA: FlgD immunoglobulin-like domain containing protein [Candidatus Eisenbacteria bacterium]|jgi:hypothetical protein
MGDLRRRNAVGSVRFAILASLISIVGPFLTIQSASAETAATTAGVVLVWTTPGDDGLIGRAAKYDLRISSKAISGTDTLSWWNAAIVVRMSTKVPGLPGARDSLTLGGLVSGTRYYAILRVADERPNWSGFSNAASFTPGIITGTPDGEIQAPSFVVGSPRPSPMSGRTEINLELPQATRVEANIYNAQGRLVRALERDILPAGGHVLRWDGKLDAGGNVGSGVYWISVAAGAYRKRMKIVVVR